MADVDALVYDIQEPFEGNLPDLKPTNELGDAEGGGKAVELVVLVGWAGYGIGCAGIFISAMAHASSRAAEFRTRAAGHLEVLQRHFKGRRGGRRVRDVWLVQRNIRAGRCWF